MYMWLSDNAQVCLLHDGSVVDMYALLVRKMASYSSDLDQSDDSSSSLDELHTLFNPWNKKLNASRDYNMRLPPLYPWWVVHV